LERKKVKNSTLKSFGQERQERLLARVNDGEGVEECFLQVLDQRSTEDQKEEILRSLNFAKSQEYSHIGLSSRSYFAHPIRVAEIALRVMDPINIEVIKIALIHNILEMTSISEEDLRDAVGDEVANAISTLTVNRTLWNEEYKINYYEKLRSMENASIVKVLDKLDNLFVIGLNPDEATRANYIGEIREYVIPMAERYLPTMKGYFVELADDCEALGYIDINKISREE
jgi:(p)ppGpp synthase/HD superfamily hydrolase